MLVVSPQEWVLLPWVFVAWLAGDRGGGGAAGRLRGRAGVGAGVVAMTLSSREAYSLQLHVLNSDLHFPLSKNWKEKRLS